MDNVLSIIQGDTFEIELTVGGVGVEILDKITFTCNDQGIVQDFKRVDDGIYYLRVESEKTKNFTPKVSSFDITGTFVDGEKVTATYQNKLLVLRKENDA